MLKKIVWRNASAVFIMILFFGMCLVPGSAVNQKEPTRAGHTLYVGGSGPGNYTKIQGAIDNATDGDTVFVFAGHYDEHLTVDVSIALTGEDRNTTIIDGQNKNYSIIWIPASDVTVSGFTIQDCGQNNNAAGIYIHANRTLIMTNTITCNQITGMEGIWCWDSIGTIIKGNTIRNDYFGLALEYCAQCTLTDNIVTGMRDWAVILGDTNASSFTDNLVTESDGGLYLRDANHNSISGNTITHNTNAIALVEQDGTTDGNNIIGNNFVHNTGWGPWFLLGNQSHSRNHWDTNYYGRPLLHPKLILGEKVVRSLPGAPFHLPPMDIVIPWLAFDRHPAQTPYV